MSDLLPITLPVRVPRPYAGPERRGQGSALLHLLALTLDEIDYGMLLIGGGMRLLHANQVARLELGAEHALKVEEGQILAHTAADTAALRDATEAALRRGLRRLLALGEGDAHTSVAVVPLPTGGEWPAALLMFGKRQVCEELSVQGFARCHGLTPAETGVLQGLCRGDQPADIARSQGVRLCTVRTQIGAIRGKTGAQSIRALVRQVAVLPPMVNALKVSAETTRGRAGLS